MSTSAASESLALSFVKLAAPILPLLWCCLPTVAGVAHRFHSTCGKNIALEEDGTRAVRAAGYAHGLVFSTKELKTEEIFEVGCGDVTRGPPNLHGRASLPPILLHCSEGSSVSQVKVEELDEKWAGSLRLGLTTLAPGDMGPGAGGGPGLPPSLPELRTKTTWMVSSCEVRRDGQLQRMNYGRNLERLGVRQPTPGLGVGPGVGAAGRGGLSPCPCRTLALGGKPCGHSPRGRRHNAHPGRRRGYGSCSHWHRQGRPQTFHGAGGGSRSSANS